MLPKRILLLIDSSPADRDRIKQFLQCDATYDYHYLESSTAEDGLKICQRILPHGIVVDDSLPDMSGLDFLDQFYQRIKQTDIPIIMLSKSGSEAIAVQAIKRGAQDYLLKEVLSANSLCRAIDNAIQQVTLQQQLKQQQERQRIVSSIALSLRNSLELPDILSTTVEEMRQYLQADRVVIHQFEAQSSRVVAESLVPGCPAMLHEPLSVSCFEPLYSSIFLEGKPYCISNITADPRMQNHLSFFEQFRVTSLLAVPILLPSSSPAGEPATSLLNSTTSTLEASPDSPCVDSTAPLTWGLLIAHQCDRTRDWIDTEVTLLEQISVQLAIAIQQSMLFQQVQQTNITLEAKVAERTASLLKANRQLQTEVKQRQQLEDEQQYLLTLLDNSLTEVYVFDVNTLTFNYVNQQALKNLGYSLEQIRQMTPLDLKLSFTEPSFRSLLQPLLAQEQEILIFETYHWRADGTNYPIEIRLQRLVQNNHPVFLAFGLDLTERVKTQTALKENETRFQLALDASGDGLWDWQIAAEEIYYSPQWTAMLGYAAQELELTIAAWEQLVHPDDWPWVQARLQAHLQDDTVPYRFEYRLRTKSGQWKWIANYGKVVQRDARGQPLRMIGTHRDIDDRVRAEQARQQAEVLLRESEATKQALIEAMPDVLIRTRRDGVQLSIINADNFNFVDHPDGSEGRNVLDCMPRHIAQRRIELIQQVLETGEMLTDEYQFEVGDQLIYEESRISRINDHETLVIVRDITDRKLAEIALAQELNKTLLLQQITDEIRCSLNPAQIFETAAQQIGQTLKVSRCSIHTYTATAPPQVQFQAEYRLDETVSSRQGIGIPLQNNPHLLKVLSQERAVVSDDVSTDPLLQPILGACEKLQIKSMLAIATFYQGQPNGLIGLHQCDRSRTWTADEIELLEAVAAQLGIAIAQVKLLESEIQQRQALVRKNEDLAKAKAEAEAANRAKSEFLANMSHEIRTPMNAILGFADLLQSSLQDTEHRSYLSAIATSGKTLLRLIDDILDLSKVEAGKLELHYEPTNIPALISDIQNIFQLTAQDKNLQLNCQIAATVPAYLLVDEIRLRQILFNVVGNAVKFTHQGSVTLWVTAHPVVLETHENTPAAVQLDIQIIDTGIGMSPENQAIVFDAFRQSDGQSTRRYGGTGLGLAITKRLIEMMGGSIELKSELGVGTTFILHFPNLIPVSKQDAALSTTGSLDLNRFAPFHCLVADDVQSNRELLASYFLQTQHTLAFAVDGEDVLHQVTVNPPDLILLDLRMPNVDGLDVARQLKSNSKTQHIYIVILTASVRSQQTSEVATYCDWILQKPVSLSQLIHVLQNILPLSTRSSSKNSDRKVEHSTLSKQPEFNSVSPQTNLNLVSHTEASDTLVYLWQQLEFIQQEIFSDLAQRLTLRKLEQFEEQLSRLAQITQYQELLDYTETLTIQIEQFDWAQLPQTVQAFASLLQTIEQKYGRSA